MIDYRRLLIKYIRHVCETEGLDFLRDAHGSAETLGLTRDEWVALSLAAVEAGENGENGGLSNYLDREDF